MFNKIKNSIFALIIKYFFFIKIMDNNKKREIKLDKTNKFNIKYGTLDKNNPEVLYIRAKAKIKPNNKKSDYCQEIASIKKDFVKMVNNIIVNDKSVYNKHICCFDANDNGMVYNKNSYIKYDIYIKPIIIKHIDEYRSYVSDLTSILNNNLTTLLEKNNMSYI